MTDLATGLSTADAADLRALVEAVETAHTALCAADAEYTRTLAALNGFAERLAAQSPLSVRERDMARRTVAAEAAVPLRLSDRGLQSRMHDASTLVTDYPATFASWEAGRISRGHVHTVVTAGQHLDPENRQVFDTHAAVICEETSVTRAKDTVTHLAERLHPRTPTDRHRGAREGRCLWVTPLGEGMSRVSADVPTILGEGILDRLDRIATAIVDTREQARSRVRDARAATVAGVAGTAGDVMTAGADGVAGTAGDVMTAGADGVAGADGDEVDPADHALAEDTRTKDQIRADAFCDLLLAGQPGYDPTSRDGHGDLGAIRGHVQVVVTATTLTGADEHPADLAGVNPVDAATARELAGDAPGWDRLLTHPVTGQVLATDRYTPTPELRRRLRARDRHCRFPGCRVPALRCEHDHTLDYALGGKTTLGNLAGLCQRHHSMKQFTPWQVRQRGDGVLEWTSPTGRTYTDHPPAPVVHFAPPDTDPPPF